MTDADCDLLIAVSARPGRRMMVTDLKKTRLDYLRLPALIRDKHLIYFEGGWIALTDGGYAEMIKHCAKNF